MVDEHQLTIYRRQNGLSPTRPARPMYGTVGRCSCGSRFTSNQAPSKGGRKAIERLHAEHVERRLAGEV